ncbi:hypothetical protein AAC691_06620 [Nguyenibacter vanlangensis]|uniref:Uncharacterized protein n=1 Tax=Nguyenibacter vanlangensis TaxID=1216886 RepID=A0ABZ3D8K0_9PROT
MKPPARHPYLPYGLTWLALAGLLAAQLLVTRVLGRPDWAPLFGLAMAALVALFFMNLRNGSALSRIFAIACVVWLTVMLGLGIIDPLTRTAVMPP